MINKYKILVTTTGLSAKGEVVAINVTVLEFPCRDEGDAAYSILVGSQAHMDRFMNVKQAYTKLY